MWVTFDVDTPRQPTMTSITFDGPDLATLSRRFLAFCKRNEVSPSHVSDGTVMRQGDSADGDYVGRMSYNGKAWSDDVAAGPIYDPYVRIRSRT